MAQSTLAQYVVIGFQGVLRVLDNIQQQGEQIMADNAALLEKVTALEAAASAREARDQAQDSVTTAQIASLQQVIADLQAAPTVDQTVLDRIGAVVDSLNAADPTPPAVA